MLKVDEIQNGVVIDHITAGTGLALYHLMELEKLSDASVALLQNVRSQKSGKKDIIKIEGDVSGLSFDIFGLCGPEDQYYVHREWPRGEKEPPRAAQALGQCHQVQEPAVHDLD